MSFQQGLSGLNASSRNLEVIGNNVANASTVGFKGSRIEFADVYASSAFGAAANQPGLGVNVAAVAQQFTQGNISTTGNSMDLAINGAGFFQLQDTRGQTVYSRSGQFKVDREGYVVNNERQQLLGYAADARGQIVPGRAIPLQLPTAGVQPRATDEIDMEINLDVRSAVTLPSAGNRIDLTNPATYNNATSVTVYDATGQDVALTYYFQKSAADTWNVYVTANGNPISVDGAGVPQPTTTMTFPANGAAPTAPAGPVTLNIPATTRTGGATTLPIAGIQLDLTQATQYGSGFSVTNLTQTGYAPGQLTGVSIESTGIVMARYSNGQSRPAGQLELANFRNAQGLMPQGGNAWAASRSSGDPIVGTAATGNLGALQAGAVEDSNVDLTAELVNMITAQRSYQANAQTIKTQDSVLQTLVNLR
jgi:flagellar hook protein FlgE